MRTRRWSCPLNVASWILTHVVCVTGWFRSSRFVEGWWSRELNLEELTSAGQSHTPAQLLKSILFSWEHILFPFSLSVEVYFWTAVGLCNAVDFGPFNEFCTCVCLRFNYTHIYSFLSMRKAAVQAARRCSWNHLKQGGHWHHLWLNCYTMECYTVTLTDTLFSVSPLHPGSLRPKASSFIREKQKILATNSRHNGSSEQFVFFH